MKKVYLFLLMSCILFGYTGTLKAQIKVSNGGNVGIGLSSGSNAQSKLEVNGNARFDGNVGIGLAANAQSQSKLEVSGLTTLNKTSASDGIALSVNGDIKVYGTTKLYPTHILDKYFILGGKLWVTPEGAISAYNYFPTLEPSSDCIGLLGYSGKRFREIHTVDLNYNNIYDHSDRVLKKNIRQTEKEKSGRLNKVKVYTYDMDEKYYESVEDAELKEDLIKKSKGKTGVMAQELIELFPELVKQDEETGWYSVNYVGMIPHIINELQAQSAQIEQMEFENKQKNKEIEELKSQMLYMQLNCCKSSVLIEDEISTSKKANTKSGNNPTLSSTTLAARLDQNAPNPFKDGTHISFFVPENARNAGIYIYNLLGSQIKKIDINQTGEGFIAINGNQLSAGIYIYALIIDNEMIDSKKMVLTE